MQYISGIVAAAALAILLQGDAGAVATVLGDKDIERALKLAQAVEEKRAQFHAPYLVRVNDATVEQIEVVTEFRRYVLTAQDQLRQGNWLFVQGVRNAKEQLRPWRERLTIIARLRFHPQNVLIGIPPYEIALGTPDLAPLSLARTPINSLLSGRPGDFNAPLVGATLEAVFQSSTIGQTARPAILSLDGKQVASVTIGFATLE
jgi:hypothetical protein